MLTDLEKKELEALKSKGDLTAEEKTKMAELEAKAKDDGNGGKTFSEDYVKDLRNENAKWRMKVKEFEEKLSKFDSIDPDEFTQLKKEKAELEQKKLMEKGEFETLRKQLVESHAKELQKIDKDKEALQAQISKLAGELNQTILANEIANAAVIAKAINPALVEMVAIKTMKVITAEDGRRVIQVLDGKGEPRTDIKTGEPVKVQALLEEMKQSSEYAHLFAGGSAGAGSGTLQFGGTSVKNPWKAESLNLTLQGKITKENPDMAKRLKAEAGVA